MLAIADALDGFPADRIVTVYRTGEASRYREERLDAATLEQRFGIPVAAFELRS